jgi:hypothetical protein
MHALRLLGRRGATGADRPHRFVGDDDLRHAVRERVDDGGELALDDVGGVSRTARLA